MFAHRSFVFLRFVIPGMTRPTICRCLHRTNGVFDVPLHTVSLFYIWGGGIQEIFGDSSLRFMRSSASSSLVNALIVLLQRVALDWGHKISLCSGGGRPLWLAVGESTHQLSPLYDHTCTVSSGRRDPGIVNTRDAAQLRSPAAPSKGSRRCCKAFSKQLLKHQAQNALEAQEINTKRLRLGLPFAVSECLFSALRPPPPPTVIIWSVDDISSQDPRDGWTCAVAKNISYYGKFSDRS